VQFDATVPTVTDRVVQAALKLVLEPIFEADFQPCSYGFRPGRRAQDAIAEVHYLTTRTYEWVVEADIEACFDRIDHTALMDRVRDRIKDKRVLALIKAFLHAGILTEQDGFERSVTGTPQGGILSPLLANIALSALDEHFAQAWQQMGANAGQRGTHRRRGNATYRLVRYADDCAPRTRKEELSRSSVRRTRCCARDEGAGPVGLVALRGRLAGGGRKPPRGAPVKSRCAELVETARHRVGQVWITKASESEPLMRRRKRIGDIETGVELLPRDEPGGCLLIGQVVSGVKVARAWSGLSCGTREPVAPTGWSASGAVVACGRASQARTSSSGNCEGESSCAGHRGGPSRISDEGPVIGLERRGRVVLAGLAINRGDVG